MGKYVSLALDWSEVWALLIPLSVLLLRRSQTATLRPVIVYLWLALLINLTIDVIMMLNVGDSAFNLSNNPLYNTHSVVRFACFSIYFIRLPRSSFNGIKKAITVLAGIVLLLNFTFIEDFFNFDSFSGNLLAAEAYLLLIFCMLYYLAELKDESRDLFHGPDFWVVTGLCIYVVINFFVFLFYLPMIDVDIPLALNIWNVHNIAFIIFCLFITKALYGSVRYQYSK
jgi:hypothetical protein